MMGGSLVDGARCAERLGGEGTEKSHVCRVEQAQWRAWRIPPEAKLPASHVSTGLRITATLLRAIFIISLVVLTVRVSLPQNETIWTAYDTPSDLVRMAMGFAICVWLVIQLFRMPGNSGGYRTWFYLGLVAVPFTLICLAAIW